jgi:hypothetical protein
MNTIHIQSLKVPEPEQIVWQRIDVDTLQPTHIFNRNSTVLPFIGGSQIGSETGSSSINRGLERLEDTAKDVIESLDNLIR